MEKPLAGKCALVTGSYRNLGAVTAETLARYGANVVINDLDRPEMRNACQLVLENSLLRRESRSDQRRSPELR